MAFSFPTIKEFIKILPTDHKSILEPIASEKFYYIHSSTEKWRCAVKYEDDSFTALIDAFSHELAVVIMNENEEPIYCITTQQMIPFLYKYYNELQAFITLLFKRQILLLLSLTIENAFALGQMVLKRFFQ